MQISTTHLNQFKQALKDEGMRFTPQRLAILEDIMTSDDHRECDDIFYSLREQNISVSRATIYRTLEVLYQTGFVRKMDVGDGRSRYENKLSSEHHDHMICLVCGRILEFMDTEIEARQVDLAKKHHFKLERHVHQLFGTCEECQTGSSKDGPSS